MLVSSNAGRASTQVLAVTSEGLALAQREVDVMHRLHHPCLLPLLGASITPQADEEHGSKYVIEMLFPLYKVRGCAAVSQPVLKPERLSCNQGPAGSKVTDVTVTCKAGQQQPQAVALPQRAAARRQWPARQGCS